MFSTPFPFQLRKVPTDVSKTCAEVIFEDDCEADFHTGFRKVSHDQQQSFSGLHQPGRSTNHNHFRIVRKKILDRRFTSYRDFDKAQRMTTQPHSTHTVIG